MPTRSITLADLAHVAAIIIAIFVVIAFFRGWG